MQNSALQGAMVDKRPITIPRQAGFYVRQAREERGLTRDQLAQHAGVSKRMLASLELGDSAGVQLDKLLSVLSALGLGLYVGEASGKKAASKQRRSSAADPAKTDPKNQSYNDLIRALLSADGYEDGILPPIVGGEVNLNE